MPTAPTYDAFGGTNGLLGPVSGESFDGTVAGVTLRSYWSNFHGRCILPPARDPATGQRAIA